MKLKNLLFLLMFCNAWTVSAQIPAIVISESMMAPEKTQIRSRLFIATNGNTLLFHFPETQPMQTIVFDATHKQIAKEEGTGSIWDYPVERMCAIYELKEGVTLFLQAVKDRRTTLFRIVVDPATGKIISTDEMLQVNNKWKPGMPYGQNMGMGFEVEKDRYSDAYAVAVCDPSAGKDEHRIEVMHYNSDHQLLHHYIYPNDNYKYYEYRSMMVQGIDKVFLCTYDYNTKAHGGESFKIILSKMEDGKLIKTIVRGEDNKHYAGALVFYDSTHRQVKIVSMTYEDECRVLRSDIDCKLIFKGVFVHTYDADKLVLKATKKLFFNPLNAYRREYHKVSDKKYEALPYGLFPREDGSFTLLLSEQGRGTLTSKEITITGLLDVDEEDNEQSGQLFLASRGYSLNKSMFILNDIQKNRTVNIYEGLLNNFVESVSGAQYVFFNEIPQNYYADETKPKDFLRDPIGRRPYEVLPMGYKFTKEGRTEFKIVNGEEGGPYALYDISTYNSRVNVYAVVIVESRKEQNTWRIAWVELKD